VPYSSASYKHCQKPCTSNADCSGTTPACQKSTGMCVACMTNADCKSSSYPYCNASTNKCVACKTNADCKSASYPYCLASTGSCKECTADAQCRTGYKWGNKCPKTGTYSYSCRCSTNADCAGNPNGPTCYTTYQKCSCKTNADCKNKTYPNCKIPYTGATYKHCQK